MNILIIGGSGGLSGTLASMAKEKNEVWAVTRGIRPLGEGIHAITADRNDTEGFKAAVLGTGLTWDVVFDCICMNENHAAQDLDVIARVTKRLVVVSTDSVYHHAHKRTPQNEEGIFVEEEGTPDKCSYPGNKRRMEKVFEAYFAALKENPDPDAMKVTLFRPGHIYGPGFLLGCFPEHGRQKELPDLILKGEPIRLVGAGTYLTQPIFVRDLSRVMLECVDKEACFQQIFCIGGPEAVMNRRYFEIIAMHLGVKLNLQEIPVLDYLDKHPIYADNLNHRIYDLSKLRATGVKLPDTSLEDGIKIHLQALGYDV